MGRTFRKRGTNEVFHALSGFSLTVREGEFVTIVGPSGCGKSTLLDILVGLAKADEGEILIDGKPIRGPALDRGIVLQGYALFPWLSVRKNIEFGLEIKRTPKKERAEISSRFIRLVGLEGFESHYPYELSGGMQQRVAIARSLAYDPEVLFMDEPFAAVDAQTRETMQDELLAIWEKTNKTVIFVTHSIEEAVGLADRVAVVSKSPGRIKEVIGISLPRPRRVAQVRDTTDFNIATHRVWELLQDRAPERAVARKSNVDVGEAILGDAVI
ncbi:MAG: ABC transporter ATP-binding protein [Clostridiales bacterium]|nr:ABC transporter ATP-binding protein [Clostridiales bacterium]